MSRVNIEERTMQFLKQHTGGVSKAVWPSSIRRYVATGKGRRRMLILKHLLLMHEIKAMHFIYILDKMRSFCKHLLARCSCTIHIIIIVIASDIVQMLCIFYSWPTLLILTVVCTITTLIMVHLMSSGIEKYREYGLLFTNKFKVLGLRREKRHLTESTLAACSQASILYTAHEEIEQESLLLSFPDTPMPRTPLIRVMETINLSSSKIEQIPAFQDLSVRKSIIEEHRQHIDVSPQE